jgi:hypothetical protein
MRTPQEVIEIIKKIQKDIRDKGRNSMYKDKLFVAANGRILFKKSFITNYSLEKYIYRIIFRSLKERRNYVADVRTIGNQRDVQWGLLPNNYGTDVDATSVPNDLVVLNFDFNYDMYKKDNQLNERRKYLSALLRENVISETYVSDRELKRLEQELDNLFASNKIDVDFTQHFMDRVRDERNVKDITIEELRHIFKNVYAKYKDVLKGYGVGFEGVFRNDPTEINIPFTLQWDKANNELDLVAKTTMRKRDFKSVTPFLKANDTTPVKPKDTTQKDKFKKVKLNTGDIVKYYELSNRFETLKGQAIEIDDIFDHLPEELQDKVLDLAEGFNEAIVETIDEDYPKTFDKEHFESLTSFAARVRYCEEHLQRISSGSSRIAYKIDNEKVLKLAKNKKGIAQNEVEIEYSKYHDIEDIVARVFDYHPNALWVEMELARKVTKAIFSKVTGLNFDDFGKTLINHYSQNQGRGKKFNVHPEIVEMMWEDEFAYQFLDFVGGYDVPAGDLARTSSYGLVKRNGEDDIVLIDYGLTSDVYQSYYS